MGRLIFSALRRRSARFSKDEKGSIAIEAALILPVMIMAYLSLFAIFDAFRQHAITQKAAYTISDLVSRQTTPIDASMLDSARGLFDMLTRSTQESSMRMSVVQYDAANDVFEVQWSQNRGRFLPLTSADIANWNARLPVVPNLENVIIIETQLEYDPPFNTGLGERTISNFVFTRPRYAPKVCWVECPAGA